MSVSFEAVLVRFPGKGGWTVAPIPEALAPPVSAGWGRTPVVATVDGRSWETSVWRDAERGSFLPVPARIRGRRGHGDTVSVQLAQRSPQ